MTTKNEKTTEKKMGITRPRPDGGVITASVNLALRESILVVREAIRVARETCNLNLRNVMQPLKHLE